MIKRFFQLIRGRFHRQPSSKALTRLPQPPRFTSSQHNLTTAPKHPADSVVYAVPRAEIVNTLNHTLRKTASATSADLIADDINPTHPSRQNDYRQGEYASHSHPDTISSLADAAYLCERQRRYGEAERLYKQVLTLMQRQFGAQQVCVADSLSDLAALYRFQKRYDEAQPLLQQALKIRQHLLISHHLDIGTNLYHLADTYHHQRLYGKAEPLFQQALVILRQQLGSEHSLTQSVYSDLMQMLAIAIESGQFNDLTTELPPLDLTTLSDTYSWAKPRWER